MIMDMPATAIGNVNNTEFSLQTAIHGWWTATRKHDGKIDHQTKANNSVILCLSDSVYKFTTALWLAGYR